MSLDTLPTELCLKIIALIVHEADKQCLRLSCRRFLYMMEAQAATVGFRPGRVSNRTYRYGSRALRQPIISRLFQAGELFSDGNEWRLCISCLFPRNPSKFEKTQIRLNGEDICRDCMMAMIEKAQPSIGWRDEYHISYEGIHVEKCWKCRKWTPKSKIETHQMYGQILKTRGLCETCHYKKCHYTKCEGWKHGYAMKYWNHFFDIENGRQRRKEGCTCRTCFNEVKESDVSSLQYQELMGLNTDKPPPKRPRRPSF